VMIDFPTSLTLSHFLRNILT